MIRCEGCGANVGRWSDSPLCPTCHSVAGLALPIPRSRPRGAAMWLWTTREARAALATGQLAAIIRAYRAGTGISQRRLAETLGYDPTYISMIETGKRDVTDVATRLRFARHLGLPTHTLGVTEPDDADFTAMLQFGESTIRLAVIARQSGRGADAVNELWPLVTRLERRAADGHPDHDVMLLLARARAELGVSLGYVLPEERLVSAARWTGRALRLAEHLDDQDLLAFTLRVHGNELRKVDRPLPAVHRLRQAVELAARPAQGSAIVQLARAVGELGDPVMFDCAMNAARRLADTGTGPGLASPHAVHEVHVRGLLRTDRPELAIALMHHDSTPSSAIPPQWQAIMHVTQGEVLLAASDPTHAQGELTKAILIAEVHRLPHQIQRAMRAASRLPEVAALAQDAVSRLSTSNSRAIERRAEH